MNEILSSEKESIGNKMQLTEGNLLKLAYTLGIVVLNTVSIRSHSDLGNRREFIECGIHGKGHDSNESEGDKESRNNKKGIRKKNETKRSGG